MNELLIDISTESTPEVESTPSQLTPASTPRSTPQLFQRKAESLLSSFLSEANQRRVKPAQVIETKQKTQKTQKTDLLIQVDDDDDHGNGEENDDDHEENNDDDNSSESESESENENNATKKDLTVLQKRRADYDAFDSWMIQNRGRLGKDDTKKSRSKDESKDKSKDGSKDGTAWTDSDDKTAAAMVREFESAKIIENPRDYQIELFEKAKQKNVIAVLDTGSGKTLIAALLLRWTIDQELEAMAQGQPKRVSFFLVDKVALVFQQHAVLDCNLSHPVARFAGDHRSDLRWSSSTFWANTVEANMVVVCTADILLKCLYHSYVCMDQINLLIFDEAHHTKKNHSYARIIKDFYAPAVAEKEENTGQKKRLPKIFGMTASPVDARTNVTQAAQELETLLHSEIATVAPDTSSSLRSVARPKQERIVYYHLALRPPPTELTCALEALVGSHRAFSKHFQFVHDSLYLLGPWMMDRFWQHIFRAGERAKQEARAEIEGVDVEEENNNDNVEAVQKASRLVEMHSFKPPTLGSVSNKVKRLQEALFDEFTKSTGDQTRCIVFVDQRNTAVLLADLFQREPMAVANLRPGILVGGGSTDMGSNSFRSQLVTIGQFKQGVVNCLFATSVAEEGLDIPDCNLVIRFDLYQTMIQYVQSRGRARRDDSVYIHMAERGNREHSRLLAEHRASEDTMRHFCASLPEDRKLGDIQSESPLDVLARYDDAELQSFTVPSTKAKLTYRSSLVILAQFVSTLPDPTEGLLQTDYAVFGSVDGYVCEVSLPSSSPIRRATGQPHRRKQLAKCAAAYAMCRKLLDKKYLDDHLKPVFASKLPAMRNARLAISSKKQTLYRMRNKPTAWSELGIPSQLFATVLRLGSPEALGRPSRPVVLLTRKPIIPRSTAFPLFFGKNRSSQVHCLPLSVPLQNLSEAELDLLTQYTFRVFDDMFSKEYQGTAADVPYFVAPCHRLLDHAAPFADNAHLDHASNVLDWSELKQAAKTPRVSCEGDEPDEFFQHKFVADPYDGSRKFYLRRVRRDLHALDPVPEGVPPPKHRAWTRAGTKHDILNYSISLWTKSRAKMVNREDQPVVEAELVVQRRNLLDDRVEEKDCEETQDREEKKNDRREKKKDKNKCFLVLDMLRISILSVDVVAMLFNLPPIIHRLESTMIALEATKLLHLTAPLRPSLALEALTKDCDSGDVGDGTDAVTTTENTPLHFQAGMGHNYERLELLGDSFLKMAASIALYTLAPDKDEFEYHVQRMCMVCNRNLFNTALDLRLEEYIRSRAFDRSWYPEAREGSEAKVSESKTSEGKTSEEKTSEARKETSEARRQETSEARKEKQGLILKRGRRLKQPTQHALGDKTIADVCEALIGAAYLTTYDPDDCSPQTSFDLAVQTVTAVVGNPKFHPMRSFADYYRAFVPPVWQSLQYVTAAQQNMADTIAAGPLGWYKFRNPRLLRSALTHPSYPRHYEQLPSYQRLEFLGDALFDMAAVDDLFHRYPDRDPQWLTEHKMAMVSNQFLAALAVRLGLHRHVLSFSAALQQQILEYVARLEDAYSEAQDQPDYWVNVTRPLKVLADVVEAYLGALFVDAGYDYAATVAVFFRTHVRPFFQDMRLYDAFAGRHPVTLAVRLLAQRFACRDWRVVVQETPLVDSPQGLATMAVRVAAGFLVHGRVIGHGIAESGRYAKVAAAKQALAKLDGLSPAAFRALTGCNCQEEHPAETDDLSTAV